MMRNISGLAMFCCLLLLLAPVAEASRSTTVIDGPGFRIEEKKGLFGSSKKSYYDALGNRYEKKRNWFGQESQKSHIFGSHVEKSGNNTTITAPDGTVLVQKKNSWLKGTETHINGNGAIDSLIEFFKSAP